MSPLIAGMWILWTPIGGIESTLDGCCIVLGGFGWSMCPEWHAGVWHVPVSFGRQLVMGRVVLGGFGSSFCLNTVVAGLILSLAEKPLPYPFVVDDIHC